MRSIMARHSLEIPTMNPYQGMLTNLILRYTAIFWKIADKFNRRNFNIFEILFDNSRNE